MLFGLVSSILLILPLTPAAAQNYPGAVLFNIQCGSGTITFIWQGTPYVQVTLAQAAIPLAQAISAQQNQPIASNNGVSVWALKSNELQVHLDKDPDKTKLVVSSGICGQITTPNTLPTTNPTDGYGQATALAQAYGSGWALAYAQVTGYGQAIAVAQALGSGQTSAYTHTTSGGAPTPAGCTRVYVVRPGENLFRIALNNGVSLEAVRALNNISDPTRIYVGQNICLP
jgi:LysM repeat protein